MTDAVSKEALDAGRGYESLFVPALFAPWTKHLIAGAAITDGCSVLDIACGSGVLAREALGAAGEAGRVVGLDPAPGMIAAAREIAPAVEWVLGRAEDLGFDDAGFDRVVSQFGMMFFTDPRAAVREMHRVMATGGRLAIAVWNSVDHNPAYADMIAVLDELVGPAAGDALRLPFSMGASQDLENLLEESDFVDVRLETRTEQGRFPDARTMVEAELRGWLPLFGITLGEDAIEEILAAADGRLSRYVSTSGEAVFPTSAHIVTARKP